jgi:hypothetical protein
MKKFKVDIEFVKRLVFSMLAMSAILILIELYVPIKRMFLGNKLMLSEILNDIQYLHYFPYILAVGIAIGFFADSSENQKKK